MSNEPKFVSKGLGRVRPSYQPDIARMRNLGAAILLAAVLDYRSLDEEWHTDAERFLYPLTPESRAHYDWVISLEDGLNAKWVRNMLDRSRTRWDGQRNARVRATGRRRTSDEARKCS
jgi:hypothetical protein